MCMHMYTYTPPNAVSKFTTEQTLKRLLKDFAGCSRTLNLSGKVGVVVVTYMYIPYSGKFSWVQIFTEIPPDPNFHGFIFMGCARSSDHTPILTHTYTRRGVR